MFTSKNWKIIGISFAALFWLCSLFAQVNLQTNEDYHIEPFPLPDGPSGNSINCIVQGPNGFLWFGGHTGLYRYDGNYIKTYKSHPTDSTSLPFAYVEWLFWSSDDYLWIGTFGGGLIRFDPSDESFIRYQHDPTDSTSLSNDRITHIIEESPNILWVGTIQGLNRFDRKKGTFERFYAVENDVTSLTDDNIRVLHIDRQKTLWVGTGFIYENNELGGLNKFNAATKTFTQYLHDPNDPNTLAGNVIKAIYEDSKGNFWVGGMNGLHLMNRKTGTFQRMLDDPTVVEDIFAPGFEVGAPANMVHALLEDNEQHLWIFSLHGPASLGSIARVDLATNKMEIVQERTNAIPWQVTQCMDGSIWMAGAGVGRQVHKIRPANSQFRNFNTVDSDHGTPHNIVFEGLVNYQDGVIAGKSTNPITEKPMMHSINFDYGGYRDYPNFELKMHSSQVNTIFNKGIGLVTYGDDVWGCTGSNASGLFTTDPHKPAAIQVLHDPKNPNSPPTNIIYKIIKDRAGNFWTANRFSVSKINPGSQTFTNFLPDSNDSNTIRPNVFLDIFEDQSGHIWAGGVNPETSYCTLERINSITGKVAHAVIASSIVGNPVIAISQDYRGDIYFIVVDRGLYVLKKEDIESGDWQHKMMAAPVEHAKLRAANNLIADNEGKLWLTTSEGKIARFDTQNNTVIEFDNTGEGTLFLDRAAFKMKDGTIYFSTLNKGLVAVNPSFKSTTLFDEKQTQICFTDFVLNGKNIRIGETEILDKPIWKTDKINLTYQENTFGLRFSSFDLKNPENNQYEVRLLPVEKDWRRITGEPMVNYYGLSPDHYTLEVKGSDSNGIWAQEVAKMDIHIAPPWWKTWWAYGFYGLTMFSFLYFLRKSELQKQAEKLAFEKAQRAKEQAVNEQLRKINTAAQKFVPNAFLRSLGKENITDVVLGDHAEQKVTVSFSDIRAYTTLSEQMTPEENFKFVSSFNSRMSPAIHRHEGFINQYLGDAIMAIFPKQPSDALAAAIEMQVLLQQYNQSRQAKGKSLLKVGMGLHSGSLVMGIIGDDQRMDAATISDTVNVAARIESLTKHFGVNILLSEDTFNQLAKPNAFNCRYLGKVLVKGKHRAIGIYECFDGDSKAQQQLKQQTLATFKNGLSAYFDKAFPTAIAAFETILATNPEDKCTQLFLEKATYFITNKVEKDWTGVEKMEWK